ncbi:hypothetical protein FSS13T_23690 [Flavobacterium saliperosum S13]|uniref:Gliding motility-associated C-terminal domain-containing protein n=2 Tax=Flavobacterium saliperosum TaxID=329186 RepID=A0A1G4VMK8_9FLAO|nr:T9SS C-terminal target domain-containing protein [Flavobacterium saliperosum]ESU23637.1 hypothetical protein FSS13T_23690 [Flavobacterium saliperosum S13]SCX09079.1 gliding motility-associated C-terminal domain-containing protein [Flavobacterium saliperosum]
MKNTCESLSVRYRYITIFFFFLFFNFSFSQLSSFTLQVTATNETCSGNGSLTFTVANTTPGATVIYTLFRLPDVISPITITSTNSFTGLVAGNYRVVATQSLGTASNSQQQDITIVSQIVLLNYNLVGENEVCGNDGKITVNVTQGNAVSYEIFSGPMIRPLQASNIFTGLTSGSYQVRVFDNCGEGVVRAFTVDANATALGFYNYHYILDTCNTINVSDQVQPTLPNGIIAYPITLQYTVFPPSGAPIQYTQTINSGNPNVSYFSQILPLYYNQHYSYSLQVTNSCGEVYVKSQTIDVVTQLDLRIVLTRCDKMIRVMPVDFIAPYNVTFLSAPSGFNASLYNSNHPGPFGNEEAIYYNPSIPLPNGLYTIQITDSCGRTAVNSILIEATPPVEPRLYVNEGCQDGFGGFYIFSVISMQNVTMTAAPSSYNQNLPYDVSFNLDSVSNDDHVFLMGDLPQGNYQFNITDVCGHIYILSGVIEGYQDETTINIIENCGSFDIDLHHTSNSVNSPAFFLQKFDPLLNAWVHPLTGVVYPDGSIPTILNSIQLINNTVNYNFAFTGEFRIIKDFTSIGSGVYGICIKTLDEFTFTGLPEIDNVYSFQCNDGSYDVLVEANGVAPLIYRITTKDGLPFVIDNGTSSFFPSLSPAIYNFQVEDACGNILNRIFEISDEVIFPITPSELCAGQPGSLSVPNFPFLHYEWWKDNNTTNILSTTNLLQLNPFSLPADFGAYHVRITNPGNPNSCINEVIDYTISPDMANPNAGGDNNVSYCGSQGVINLFNSLSGTYQANGIWQETTGSGVLNNNLWDSALVNPGVYHFTYTVNGLCGNSDESQVTIEIKSTPQAPVASVAPVVCDAQTFQLFASDIPNATYQWTGPNGFSSTVQNPTIDNASNVNEGIYTVSVFEDGCESNTASVEVFVNRSPAFDIVNECIGNSSSLSAVPLNDSFNVDTAVYSWTYPDGTVVNTNPVTITGQETGSYVLTVTSANGCSASKSIDVLCTNCGIPRGISPNNDGLNDTFDLSCLQGIVNVKIFNRYGMNVYELDNYVDQWDGKDFKGRLLPAATYYYVVKFDTGNVKTGWVYLNY